MGLETTTGILCIVYSPSAQWAKLLSMVCTRDTCYIMVSFVYVVKMSLIINSSYLSNVFT